MEEKTGSTAVSRDIVSSFSGFLIARRHVRTAGHCRPQAGDIVSFLPATPRPGADEAAPRADRTSITVSEAAVAATRLWEWHGRCAAATAAGGGQPQRVAARGQRGQSRRRLWFSNPRVGRERRL